MRISDMKIGVRLSILAGLLLLAITLIGLQGWYALNANYHRTEAALEHASLMKNSVDTARHAQMRFKTQIQEWKNTLLRGNDPAALEKYRDAFIQEGNATQELLANLKAMLATSGMETSGVVEAKTALAELQAKYLDALQSYDTANKDSAQIVDKAVKGMDRAPTEKINGIVAYVLAESKKAADTSIAESQSSYKKASTWMLGMIVVTIACGIAATVGLTRSITGPISQAVKVAKTVAAGDLTSDINASGRDETGQLMEALKNMNDRLAKIVAEVRTGTEHIAGASTEIASGNLDLSTRTEQQASSLEETASSMEELTSTVKQNADHARQANILAQAASEIASKGGSVVSDVVVTMDSINESAKKIVDIISVIDGIAFQTNILALNAAVEAARAGEQGRGFAVVASEVRSLAQRSASAAKEIKALIGTSVEKVDSGSRLVSQAGSTMREIEESIQRVTDIVDEISVASQEQTSGIDQINLAITQMDQVTQQNAALVEQAAAAAEAMQDRAARLAQLVSVFKVGTGHNQSSTNQGGAV